MSGTDRLWGRLQHGLRKGCGSQDCQTGKEPWTDGRYLKGYVGYVHAVAHSLGGQYNVPHGLANAVLLPYVLEAYGENIDAKLHCLAMAAGIADRETPAKQAAADFIQAVKDMKKRFGIGDKIKEIRREDIPKLARYADREANPLYPVPVLMDAKELELFYNKLLEE